MRAGNLRHRVTLQSRSETSNAYGKGPGAENWSDVATVWGSIRPLRGQEYVEARSEQASLTHEIMIRYYGTIKPDEHRLQWTDRESVTHTYDIESVVDPSQRGRMQVIRVREQL